MIPLSLINSSYLETICYIFVSLLFVVHSYHFTTLPYFLLTLVLSNRSTVWYWFHNYIRVPLVQTPDYYLNDLT